MVITLFQQGKASKLTEVDKSTAYLPGSSMEFYFCFKFPIKICLYRGEFLTASK